MSEPWAAPDARPEEPPPRIAFVAGPGGPSGVGPGSLASGAGAGSGADAGPPELPVPLRPLTAGDRVDGALRILKLAPGPVVGLAAAAVVPVHVLAALVLDGGPTDLGGDEQFEAVLGKPIVTAVLAETGGQLVAAVLLVLLEVLAVSFVAAGLGALVTGWYLEGRQRTTGELISLAVGRLPAVAVAWVLVHLVEAAFGSFAGLPALAPMAWFSLVAPIIGAERLGPVRAMRRSVELTRRAFGIALGTCLVVAFVDVVLRFALTAIGILYVDLDLPAAWAVTTLVTVGSRLVTVPFVAGAAVLLYLDLRVRLEGLDIDLAADERFPDAR